MNTTSRTLTPRNIVIGCLIHSSPVRDMISTELWARAYLACDGFGKVTTAWANDQCWDWTHVREASDEAYKRASRILCRGIAQMDNAGEIFEILFSRYGEVAA